MQVSGVISCISGGYQFPRFSDGVFSKIQWGWGPLDGVSVKRMGFQWGWLKVNEVALKVMGSTFDGDVTGGSKLASVMSGS